MTVNFSYEVHSEIRYTPQCEVHKMMCTLHSEISYTPQMWSAQDDMYIALWDQIYPPKDVKCTRWHVHAYHICMHCAHSEIPPIQLDLGMKYQLLFWDEVYRLWYFNVHITTLVISEKLLYDIYWGYKETNQDFPSFLQQIHMYRHGNIRYGKSMK